MTILSDVCIFIENRWSLLLGTKVVLFYYLQIKLRIIYVFLQRKFVMEHLWVYTDYRFLLICVTLCNLRWTKKDSNDYYRTTTIIRHPPQCRRHVQVAKGQFRPSSLLQWFVRLCRLTVFIRAGATGGMSVCLYPRRFGRGGIFLPRPDTDFGNRTGVVFSFFFPPCHKVRPERCG